MLNKPNSVSLLLCDRLLILLLIFAALLCISYSLDPLFFNLVNKNDTHVPGELSSRPSLSLKETPWLIYFKIVLLFP